MFREDLDVSTLECHREGPQKEVNESFDAANGSNNRVRLFPNGLEAIQYVTNNMSCRWLKYVERSSCLFCFNAHVLGSQQAHNKPN